MDNRSDENLVIACCEGEKSAYALLIERHYKQVFMLCLGILGNIHDAEDIAQDAMLQGFMQIKKLKKSSCFGPWIMSIAKNMCINLIRRKGYSREALFKKSVQSSQVPCSCENLQLAIEKLSLDVRLPLVMFYFNGQSAKNVAEKLDIAPATVYLKLRTAVKQLYKLLVKPED